MNILKPQNLTKLETRNLSNDINTENIEYVVYSNENVSNKSIQDIEFEYCKFINIILENGRLERVLFTDVIFEN